jgi:ribosome biogenesis protein Nip4
LRLLRRLLRELNSAYNPGESEVLRINDKYFTLDPALIDGLKVREGLVYAGRYLGRDRRLFEPSSLLLQMLASEPDTRKVHVGRAAAWLFVCGRDIFEENITSAEGDLAPGGHFLVIYSGQCLGYGRYETVWDRIMLRNLFNIGDFLHREDSTP